MKKLIFSLLVLTCIFTRTSAVQAFDVNSASLEMGTNPLDVQELTTITAETDMLLFDNFNGLGALGADLSVEIFAAGNRRNRFEPSVALFLQPKDWLRVGFKHTRKWGIQTDSYTDINQVYFHVGWFNVR